MKLVINESQYNRVFNKPKTKLVITESQYNRLILEQKMSDAIRKIKAGDAIMVTTLGGSELHFKVIDAFSGQILMINCNNGVHKNEFWFLTASSLQGDGKLSADIEQHKNIKDTSSIKSIKSDVKNWKQKNNKIKDFKVFEGAGTDLNCNLDSNLKAKFNVNVDTGAIEEPGQDNIDNSEPTEEDTRTDAVNDLLNTIRESKLDNTYLFEFKGGGQLNLIVTSKDSSSVSWEIDSAYGSEEADRYKELVGNQIEFKLDPKNIDLKVKEVKDDKTGKVIFKPDYADIKMKKYVGGAEDGGDVKSKSEDFIIYAIDNYISSDIKSQIDSEEDEFSGLSDDEIEAQFKEFMKDDKILRNALWRKPNAFLEFIGVAKERGIIPADEKLTGWFKSAEKNAKLLKDFKTGEQKMIEFTQFRVTDSNTKDIPMKEGRRYYTIVKKRGPGDIYPNLATNFQDKRTSGAFKYRIDILKELQDNDNFKIYEVILKGKPDKGKKLVDIGEGKIKIIKSNKDKNKEKK